MSCIPPETRIVIVRTKTGMENRNGFYLSLTRTAQDNLQQK